VKSGGEKFPSSTSGMTAMQVAIKAARCAGDITLNWFTKVLDVSYKGRTNPVTQADLEAETAVLNILQKEFPEYPILAEESGLSTGSSTYKWYVDPLDGTRNFVQGIPHFCTAIALADSNEVIIAATYDPIRKELFTAEKGKGAYLNENPIKVGKKLELENSMLGFDLGYSDEEAAKAIELISHIWPNMQSFRLMGSSALAMAYTACGRIDLYFHQTLSPWDVAGGILLVREAGGVCQDRYNKHSHPETQSIIGTNKNLLQNFLIASSGSSWIK
jgi:myo-inositol-1(or 4)-monophosphatase